VSAAVRQTARWVGLVYGSEPLLDDPAEAYHEASKISPSQIGRQVAGAARLDGSPDLQLSSTRAVKRVGGELVRLPTPHQPDAGLWQTLRERTSTRRFGPGPVQLAELSALLLSAYGVTHALDGPGGEHLLPLRAVPSGGALYPLEVFAAVLAVDALAPGVYHFDPLRTGLETVRHGAAREEIAQLSTYPEIAGECAVLFLVAAVFGRTRFKYGQRGYRFALLEAGHVAQNLLLAATALGLASVPLGGFYDRHTDEFLGLDGVNDSVLYTVAVGRPDGD
jgi:SagB-type dehydrogenase family enzyme